MNQLATVRSLQQRISEMQPLRLGEGGLPVAAGLRPLLPGGALRKGGSVAVSGSLHLALALLAEASRDGAWCGAIGLRHLGFEAVAQLGISLERFVLVPEPGRHSLGVAGMLSEVLAALVLVPGQRYTPNEIERLHARLRDHGTVLIAIGEWPRGDTSLQLLDSCWRGVGRGHGLLETQELTVRSLDRRGQRRHTVRFCGGRLAGAPGEVRP